MFQWLKSIFSFDSQAQAAAACYKYDAMLANLEAAGGDKPVSQWMAWFYLLKNKPEKAAQMGITPRAVTREASRQYATTNYPYAWYWVDQQLATLKAAHV
jgi:hypothetical protein